MICPIQSNRYSRGTVECQGEACSLFDGVGCVLAKIAASRQASEAAQKPERTCRVVNRNDFDGALKEHSIWYECGFGLLIADGTQEPRYCPGCGAKVEVQL